MKKKVLVVDDNGSNLMLEKDLLELAGFTVFVAENASSGIAIARKEKPDIIVMDVRLPDMRGTEAARILRQDKETRDIPIVFARCRNHNQRANHIRAIAITATTTTIQGAGVNPKTFTP